MHKRGATSRKYSVGYFSRKHNLQRESAKLVLAVAEDTREANRLARAIKFRPKTAGR